MKPLALRSASIPLFALFLLAAPATRSIAQDFDHDEIVENNFDIGSGGLLVLDSDLGSVDIEGGSRGEIMVRVIKGANNVSRGDAERLFERFEVSFDQSGDRLEIRGNYDRPAGRNWGNRGLHVRYEISVPEDINLDVKTAGGSISIDNIAGEARLRTSGGSLQLADIGGAVTANTSGGSIKGSNLGSRVDLHTSGGSITVEGAGGSVDANTSGGSINLSNVNGSVDASTSGGGIRLSQIAGTVNANTSGGSIEAEILGQPDEDMVLKTSGGSVTVLLDPSVRADIDAQASGGSVSTDFAVSVRGTLKRSQLQGQINGGGPMLTLRSSGGSVRIREN